MTWNEAFEEACKKARGFMPGSRVKAVNITPYADFIRLSYLNSDDSSFGFDDFHFDLPRRIPPKGTPVMHPKLKILAFSMGEMIAFGISEKGLRVSAKQDEASDVKQVFSEWVELQEVQQ